MIAALVYSLCALAALSCAWLLHAAYKRRRFPLLLWSSVCFACFTATNVLVVIDLVVFPDVDLFLLRQVTALAGLAFLLYGLVWDFT